MVYGFPEGGDSLSTTRGVISRIEHQCYAHSLITLLAGQLDAAINPGNSGGPVVVGDRIVGVVMQSLKNSENIGYMVPQPIIEHFLTDMQDGRYDGFPEDGVIVQPMENQNLKKMHGLNSEQTGALVTEVLPNSAADGFILPGDVILSIDGHRVADDCTVEFRPKERTSSNYIIQQHQIGEKDPYVLFRTTSGRQIALDRQKVETEQSRILQTYQIAADRSSDFKKPDAEQAGQIAAVTGRELKGAVIDGKR